MSSGTLTAKDLDIPGLPPGSPTHLEHLLDELTESLDLDAPSTSYRVLKRTFHYLMAYFADICSCLASILAELEFPESETPDPKNAEATLAKALDYLASDDAPDLPEVRALVSVFFEGGKPRKHSRMMGIGGKPRRGFLQLSKLCASTSTPVRKKCVDEVRRYLPFLKTWLQAAEVFFHQATILRERTTLEGQQSVITRISNQELEAGGRLELTGCPLCIPEREISVPSELFEQEIDLFVPQRAPKYLVEIIDRLDHAMEQKDPVSSCLELRNALEFLVRYFAGMTAKVLEELDAVPEAAPGLMENSRSIIACERLLNACLKGLQQQPDSLAAKSLVSTFYRRNESYEFVPRWHTEILALQGALASWCLLEPGYGEMEEPEKCRQEFEKYIPTLRDWLLSIGGYLQNTEHFFEEPAEDGSVDVSVRIGDKFIEIKSPGYQLWLNNPRPEAEAARALPAEAGARKPLVLEPLEVPRGCPEVLSRILKRLDIYLRLGDPIEACVSLRDSVDYLTRYFAGLAAAAFRELGTLPEEAERLARSSLSVHDCEKLLSLSLRSIGRESSEQLGQAVRAVFFYQEEFSEGDKPTGGHARMLEMDADPDNKMQSLAEFCSLKEDEGVLASPARAKREIDRFLPILRDWLATAEPFLRRAQHHEEPPTEDGHTELVVEFEDYYLELVEPDYTFFIRPGSDEVPEVEVPSWEELTPEVEEIKPTVARMSAEELADSRALMKYRVQFIGQRANSEGRECRAGYIILTNAGGGTLSGTAVSTHPSLEVEPSRFRGNKVQLSYWLDEANLPTSHEAFILLKTADEERSVPSWEMQPKSWYDTITRDQAARMLWAIPILAMALFLCIFLPAAGWIHHTLVREVGPNFMDVKLLKDAPTARAQVLLPAQLIGWLYLFMPVLIPLAVEKLFARFPPSLQTLLEPMLRKVMLIEPLVIVAVLLAAPVLRRPITMNHDLRVMNLLRLTPWFVGFNLLASGYMELSLREQMDDWFHNYYVRQTIPTLLFIVYLVAIQLALQS